MDQKEKNYNYAINTLKEELICRTSKCTECPIQDKCHTCGADDPHFSTVLEMAIKALETVKQLDNMRAEIDNIEAPEVTSIDGAYGYLETLKRANAIIDKYCGGKTNE